MSDAYGSSVIKRFRRPGIVPTTQQPPQVQAPAQNNNATALMAALGQGGVPQPSAANPQTSQLAEAIRRRLASYRQ